MTKQKEIRVEIQPSSDKVSQETKLCLRNLHGVITAVRAAIEFEEVMK